MSSLVVDVLATTGTIAQILNIVVYMQSSDGQHYSLCTETVTH